MTEHKHTEFNMIQDGPDVEINVRLAYIDNVWVRQMHFPKAGTKNVPHYHTRDHASLLAKGSAKLTVNGKDTIYHAPAMILVLKEYKHYFEALEDDTLIYCVHGLRDKEGHIIDSEMIPDGVRPEDICRYTEDFIQIEGTTK